MIEELSITEFDMVSGGSANSVDWGDVIIGAGYLAVSGGLMYMAIDSFGATLPGAAASFSHGVTDLQHSHLF